MPQNHTTPVTAVHLKKSDLLDRLLPGSYEVAASGKWLLCVCPCGCGTLMNLPICQGTKADRAWLWDGNRDSPTLAPSIRDVAGCHFHGHLRAGTWTFEGDSGRA